MNPLRWFDPLIAYCMRVWIEDWRQRRKEEDADLLNKLRLADAKGEWKYLWDCLPQRLHGKARKLILFRIEQAARSQYPEMSLNQLIGTAIACDISISYEEMKRLNRIAFTHAEGIHKLPFAKAIHGDQLPLDVVLSILGETPTWESEETRETTMRLLLDEIDTTDQQTVDQFLRCIARYGRYYHLRAACSILKMEKPDELLVRECLEVQWKKEHPNYRVLCSLCIELDDDQAAWALLEEICDMKAISRRKRDWIDPGDLALTLLRHFKERWQERFADHVIC